MAHRDYSDRMEEAVPVEKDDFAVAGLAERASWMYSELVETDRVLCTEAARGKYFSVKIVSHLKQCQKAEMILDELRRIPKTEWFGRWNEIREMKEYWIRVSRQQGFHVDERVKV